MNEKNVFLHHDEDHHAMVLLHTFDCSIIATVELAKSFLPLFKLCLNFALIPVTSQTLRTWLQNITLKHLCLSVYFICAPPFPWLLGSSFCAWSKNEIILAQKPAIHHPLERVLPAFECLLAVVACSSWARNRAFPGRRWAVVLRLPVLGLFFWKIFENALTQMFSGASPRFVSLFTVRG